MDIPDDFIARFTAALDAAATGDFDRELDAAQAGAAAPLAAAFNRLQAGLCRNDSESNIAISGLAAANVRLLLWTEALQRITHADSILYHGGDIGVFYRQLVADAMEMMRARYGALGVFDAAGALVEFVTLGMDEESRCAIGHPPTGKGMLAAVMQSPTPVRVDEISADPRSCGFPPGHPPMHSLLGIPLRLGNTLKGVIYLAEKEKGELFGAHGERLADTFSEDDASLLGLFGDYLVRALERIELMQALQQSNRLLEKRWDEQQQLNRRLNDAQNQLLQSEKLASIGQLAAGIAHEINNPIGFINSNIGSLDRYLKNLFAVLDAYEVAQARIAPHADCTAVDALKREVDFAFLREDIFSLMRETKDGVARVSKIVQDLKDFSHIDEVEWQRADLHKGLDSTLNVVWNELKYKAEVVKEYGELPPVECLPSQLNQVFMNLLVNAAHAIAERGTITLRTGTAGDEVWIEVADTGSGIPPENLGRIFDPFFTTKPVGKGTGLGLSLSYGIMQKHHGRIEVASAPGRGTTFRVVLPIRQPAGSVPAAEAGTPATRPITESESP